MSAAKPIRFAGHEGTLGARLHLALGKARAFALFAHCFTCSKDIRAAVEISKALALHDIGVLRFDFTGLGESEGDFADTNFSSNVEDLVRAADYLRQEHQAPSILIGHSLGGAAVLQAAQHIPECKAVATIGAPAEPSHVENLLRSSRDEIENNGQAEVELAGRSFVIKKQLLEDLESQSVLESLGDLRRAVLIAHAPRDQIVGIENARLLFEAARHPKSFLSLDDADHLLSERNAARYAATVIAAWCSKYVPEIQQGEAASATDDNAVHVTIGNERFPTEIRVRDHNLRADEPLSVGGTDTGPTPYDLLLSALGACTVMTLRMYADHKKIPLAGVEVDLTHDKIHAKDCEDCESESGKVDLIERVISLQGMLSEEQRARLLEIANRCPVHRTLHGEIKIKSSLA